MKTLCRFSAVFALDFAEWRQELPLTLQFISWKRLVTVR